MIDKILSRQEFIDNPPVLLDIGASGAIHPKWQNIAKYSIGIAFDADSRDMGHVINESAGYRKHYVYNRIVTDQPGSEQNFHLTRSPHCSSLLKPLQKSLDNWDFAELFEIENTVHLKTITLPEIFSETGINKIDWFKTDSQGTDLRLFASIGDELINKVLIAEFEPGIIDAYQGEDKLWKILAYMDNRPFWMNSFVVRGAERIERKVKAARLTGIERLNRDLDPYRLITSPCWGELSYFNTFGNDAAPLSKRDFLLGWVFAIVEEQFGFALELALKGSRLYANEIFAELADHSLIMMSRERTWLPPKIAVKVNKMLRKLRGY